ncbi:MAG TPA: type II toxin-antitoxin system RelE/ParE family toxin [Thermoplasmatales archaeon]|nr:type II toxin-antitoxin system RelE/ParE family toxin [Thermoplasmatales archaeon]
MRFSIYLSASSQKFLRKLDEINYERIIKRLEELSTDPFPPDAKRIIGRKEKVFRIRVGDFRILYVVYLEKQAILISNIDKRSRIYKR